MVKYNKEFKEQALLLSDELGVKKAAEQLGISYYTIADWRKVRSRKAKEERIASDKTGACSDSAVCSYSESCIYPRQNEHQAAGASILPAIQFSHDAKAPRHSTLYLKYNRAIAPLPLCLKSCMHRSNAFNSRPYPPGCHSTSSVVYTLLVSTRPCPFSVWVTLSIVERSFSSWTYCSMSFISSF